VCHWGHGSGSWRSCRCYGRRCAPDRAILRARRWFCRHSPSGGTLAGGGPFWRGNLNDSFLILLMFMIATAVPSLALSADVAVRKRTEASLRMAQRDLDERVQIRTAAPDQQQSRRWVSLPAASPTTSTTS
jgi:hypothetical protein